MSRIIIDDFGLICTSFPELRASPLFLPAVFQVLRTEDVSVFIVASCSDLGASPEADWLLGHLVPEADYVLTTRNLQLAGQQTLGLAITKCENAAVNPLLCELRVDTSGIEVTDRLDGYQVEPDGALKLVQAAVLVQVESAAQRNYAEMVERMFKQTVADTVTVGPISEDLVYSALTHHRFGPRSNLRIIALDEFWVDLFKDTLLSPLGDVLGKADLLREFPKFCQEKMVRGESIVAMPYYLNFGVLCYRRDILDEIPQSWDAIADLIKKSLSDVRMPGEIDRGFAIPSGLRESLNCLFIEMLAAGGVPLQESSFVDSLRSERGRLTCRRFAELFLQRPSKKAQTVEPFGAGAEMATGDSCYVHSPKGALIWRHWLSTIPQFYNEHPELRGRIGIAPLPGRTSVSGEWYLAMVRGGLAQEVGKCMIEQLCSRTQALTRMELGVGLAPHSDYYANTPLAPFGMHVLDCELIRDLCSAPIQRSKFRCYSRFSRTLAAFLTSIANLSWTFGARDPDNMCQQLEPLILGMISAIGKLEEEECKDCSLQSTLLT